MSSYRRVILRIICWALGSIAALLFVLMATIMVLHATTNLEEPDYEPVLGDAIQVSDSLRIWKDNALRLNPEGLWEMKISGSSLERGEAIGKLGGDLLDSQEKAFVDKIFEMIPNRRYLGFLHYFITIFNHRLGKSVPLEYRQELKAMSASCTHEFDEFGTPYERQMQYHAAHDIGHVMQDYMLVGCTSFAVWGKNSADSSLTIGRNFDFYMGEKFSQNKLVLFERPDSGYSYVSVTWPGMIGVLSGMNTAGLTVTINASKLETPSMSATPISILTKRILQYASDIDEALRIAGDYKTFVSESIMIGSAKDGRAAIIEKTPSRMAMYDPACLDTSLTHIVCTNHYQSDLFRYEPVNQENIRMSDSNYRFLRVEELIDSLGKISPESAAMILRDTKGIGGESIGYCNELSVNQLLAMHSVIFQPEKLRIWVSTSPWQYGKFICYELDKVMGADFSCNVSSDSMSICEDSFIHSRTFADIMKFKQMQTMIDNATKSHLSIPEDSLSMFENLNPLCYNGYNIAGNYYDAIGKTDRAMELWTKSLEFKMKPQERKFIEDKILAVLKKKK